MTFTMSAEQLTFWLAKTVLNNEWNVGVRSGGGHSGNKITVNCNMAIPQNVEHNEAKQEEPTKDTTEEEDNCPVKVLILDIVLPLVDLCLDVTKAMLLIFDESFVSLSNFASHFNSQGEYGLISLSIKWTPSIVTILHFQDVNRFFSSFELSTIKHFIGRKRHKIYPSNNNVENDKTQISPSLPWYFLKVLRFSFCTA